jgi:hypothetical protein
MRPDLQYQGRNMFARRWRPSAGARVRPKGLVPDGWVVRRVPEVLDWLEGRAPWVLDRLVRPAPEVLDRPGRPAVGVLDRPARPALALDRCRRLVRPGRRSPVPRGGLALGQPRDTGGRAGRAPGPPTIGWRRGARGRRRWRACALRRAGSGAPGPRAGVELVAQAAALQQVRRLLPNHRQPVLGRSASSGGGGGGAAEPSVASAPRDSRRDSRRSPAASRRFARDCRLMAAG